MHFYGMPLRILLIDIGSRKRINIVSNQLPAAKVEVADAKVGSFDTEVGKNGLQTALEGHPYVVEYLRHFSPPPKQTHSSPWRLYFLKNMRVPFSTVRSFTRSPVTMRPFM